MNRPSRLGPPSRTPLGASPPLPARRHALPHKGTVWSAPLVVREATRAQRSHPRQLFVLRPGLRKSAWGTHIGLLGPTWPPPISRSGRMCHRLGGRPRSRDATGGTRRVVIEDSDRSTWRPSTSDERINLAPEAICRPQPTRPTPAPGMVIRTGQARDRAPDNAHRGATSEVVIAACGVGVSEGARAEVQPDTVRSP